MDLCMHSLRAPVCRSHAQWPRMRSLWPALVSTGVVAVAVVLVLVVALVAARRWTSLTAPMMVQKRMTDVYTACVRW
jgi:hypothetical protein